MTKVAPAYDRNVDTAAEEASAYEQQVNEDVGGASEKRLAELMGVDTKLIDAAVLKLVAFRCSKVRAMDPRLYGAPAWADGLRWVALSGPEAAKGLTRMLQTPVSQHQAKRALDRVFARGLLRREKHLFNDHGTCWYRLDAVAVGKLLDPEGEGAEIRELVRRPRGARAVPARQSRGARAVPARLIKEEPLADSPEPEEPEGLRTMGGPASQRPPVGVVPSAASIDDQPRATPDGEAFNGGSEGTRPLAPLVDEFVCRLRDELAVAGVERDEHAFLVGQFDDEWDDPANRGGRAALIRLATAQMVAGLTPANAASLLVHKYPLPVENDVRSVVACLLRRAADGSGWSSWDYTDDDTRWAKHIPRRSS